MNPNIAQKVRNAMKAGYDKTGTTYTPPREVSVAGEKLIGQSKVKKAAPKVSKSAEKARLKEERISNLKKQLIKEKAVATAEANAKAQKSYKDNLMNIANAREKQNAANAERIKQIQASEQKGIKMREEEARQNYMKEMENKKRLKMVRESQRSIY
jgi:ribosomal protein L17